MKALNYPHHVQPAITNNHIQGRLLTIEANTNVMVSPIKNSSLWYVYLPNSIWSIVCTNENFKLLNS
jgi:hypothetical protein